MHDADIRQITWDVGARTVTLCVDDLNSNFEGLPEYGGRIEAKFTFEDIEDLLINCDSVKEDIQRIYRLEIFANQKPLKYGVLLNMWPSGRMSFVCNYVKLTV